MERNLLLLVLSTFLFGGDSFYYWAKITTKNSVVVRQEFSVSPIMNKEKLTNNTKQFLCTIKQKKTNNQTSYDYLQKAQSQLFECFLGQNLKVYGYDDYKQKLMDTSTIFFIHPIRFTVDFKEDFANIYLLNQ